MYGAIIGDIVGSIYERANTKTTDFELFTPESTFTDDTVLSVAVAEKILRNNDSSLIDAKSYALWYKQYYKRYPNVGYGQMFSEWASEDKLSVRRSFGNGAAMRVCAIGYAFNNLKDIFKEVKASCYYTHRHKEAITGANAIAATIFFARYGLDKNEIQKEIEKRFKYKLNFTLDEIRKTYVFDSRTSYTVPPAIKSFLESDNYEDAIRKAISIGGDSDTIACMTGGIAEAYYKKIPDKIISQAKMRLNIGLKNVLDEFCQQYTPE